jgi:hypothetical protein
VSIPETRPVLRLIVMWWPPSWSGRSGCE